MSTHLDQIKWHPSLLLIFVMIFFELPLVIFGGRCERHCDNYRPSGSTNAFVLDCQEAHEYDEDIDKCQEFCKYCVQVCNPDKNTSIFNCPAINVSVSSSSESEGTDFTLVGLGCFLLLDTCIGACILWCICMKRRRLGVHPHVGQYYGAPLGGMGCDPGYLYPNVGQVALQQQQQQK